MKTIFLTGATGYIGSAVADELLAAGYKVVGLSRSPESDRKLLEKGITVRRGHLAEWQNLTDAAQQADAVIHTAFELNLNDLEFSITQDKQAVQALIKGLAGSNKVFISTSGTAVYGDTGNDKMYDETVVRYHPLFGQRAVADDLVLQSHTKGVHSVVIRPPNVYGRGGSMVQHLINLSRQVNKGIVIGQGTQVMSSVHVADLAKLYVLALEKSKPGQLYLATAECGHTFSEFIETIVQTFNLPERIHLSAEEATQYYGPLAYYLQNNCNTTGHKAKTDLGWQPEQPGLLEEIRLLANSSKL